MAWKAEALRRPSTWGVAVVALGLGLTPPAQALTPAPILQEAPYRGVPGSPLVWLGRSGRLAYLGQAPGGGVLLAWDVVKRQVGRLGVGGVTAMDAAPDGRLAWVERLGLPIQEPVASPTGAAARGPDKLWVQDLASARRTEVLGGVEILPRSLAFDARQNRLAVVLKDDRGQWRLAVQASGAPLELWPLDASMRVLRVVGWLSSGEALLEADRPGRQAALVAVGATRARVLPHVEGAKLSPDGKSILGRAPGQPGVLLRGAGGGGRWLSPSGEAFAWSAHPAIAFVGLGGDLLALGTDGRLRRRYPQALPPSGFGQSLVVSADPSGRHVAFMGGDRLWVRRL